MSENQSNNCEDTQQDQTNQQESAKTDISDSRESLNNNYPTPPQNFVKQNVSSERPHSQYESSQQQDALDQNSSKKEPAKNFKKWSNSFSNSSESSRINISQGELSEFQTIRRYSIYSIAGAAISFIFGGTLLSIFAVIFALVCWYKVNQFLKNHPNTELETLLKRRVIITMIASVLALILNIIAVVILYPYIMQAATTGDYSSLFGGSSTISSSSTWG